MLMEIMGLQLPGSSFVNPDTAHRDALNKEVVRLATESTKQGEKYRPLYKIVDEKAIVNAIIGLLATGGSTNHTLHLIAIAKSAGIIINWQDFSDLSSVIPSLVKNVSKRICRRKLFPRMWRHASTYKNTLRGWIVYIMM